MRKKNAYIGAYWHPNVMVHKRADGTEEYAIHEVRFNAAGQALSWTLEAISPRMPSVQALTNELVRLFQKAQRSNQPVMCGDSGDPTTFYDIASWLKYIDAEPLPWDVFYSDEELTRIEQESRSTSAEPRVLLHKASNGSDEYAIHELYYNVFGTLIDWTDDAHSPRMPTVVALRAEIERLLQEAQPPKYRITCGDKNLFYTFKEVQSWLDATEKDAIP